MKLYQSVACLVVIVGVAASGRATTASPQDNGPSLADTMKFIQDKFNAQTSWAYTLTFEGTTTKAWTGKFEDVVADPAACTFRATSVASQFRITTSFALKDLTSVQSGQTTDGDPQSAFLQIETGGDLITQIRKVNPDDKEYYKFAQKHNRPMEEDSHVNHAGFPIWDINIADRLAKAMTHAGQLCGAKPEPF